MGILYLHKADNGWEARQLAEKYLSLYREGEQPNVLIIYWHTPYTVILCPSFELADQLRNQMEWLKFDLDGIGPIVQASCLIYTGTRDEFLKALTQLHEIQEAFI